MNIFLLIEYIYLLDFQLEILNRLTRIKNASSPWSRFYHEYQLLRSIFYADITIIMFFLLCWNYFCFFHFEGAEFTLHATSQNTFCSNYLTEYNIFYYLFSFLTLGRVLKLFKFLFANCILFFVLNNLYDFNKFLFFYYFNITWDFKCH
jgi:hypothetical protein